MKIVLSVSLGFVIVACASKDLAAQESGKPGKPTQEYQALVNEFSAAARVIHQEPTDEERRLAAARADKIPSKLLELAENNPKEPVALDALIQVVTIEYWLNVHTSHPGWGKDSRQARAIAVMLRDHIESEKLGDACKRVHYGFRQECETFLRTVLEKSPHREVQGLACLRLAQFLLSRMDRLDLMKDQPQLASRYEGLYGKDYLAALQRQDRDKITKEAETLYERASEQYADVQIPYDNTVGETAKRELFEVRYLSVGKQAPDMEGVDQNSERFKLSDYRGKVVLLYFWSEF